MLGCLSGGACCRTLETNARLQLEVATYLSQRKHTERMAKVRDRQQYAVQVP